MTTNLPKTVAAYVGAINNHPTIEQFRELIKQADDRSGHHILWVKKNGDVERYPLWKLCHMLLLVEIKADSIR